MEKAQKIIGVCVSQLADSVIAKLVQTISRRAAEEGYYVMFFGCFEKLDIPTPSSRGEASIFSRIPMQELSVLILLGQTILDRELLEAVRDRALEQGVPVITVDYELEHCFNIQLDYSSTFCDMVRHVVEEHHSKNPFFMAGFRGNDFSERRLDVYRRILRENHLPVIEEHIGYGDFWEVPARAACEEWMKNKEDLPDAIICANDVMALSVCSVLDEHGLRVPEDVIVTGFDAYHLVEHCSPHLTTAGVDQEEIVRQIFGIIDDVRQEPDKEVYSVTVPFHLQKSESCGCIPEKSKVINLQMMEVYGQMAHDRLHINDTFRMLTSLTEGYSMMGMLEMLERYIREITEGNVYLFVNSKMCRHTDIPVSRDFQDGDILLLMSLVKGMYSIPLREKKNQVFSMVPDELWEELQQILFLPIHWQSEVYGYMALQFYNIEFNYEYLNDFMMTLTHILGTVRKHSQLHEMYIRDALTSTFNRRGFYGKLSQDLEEMGEGRKKIFLASVDLDGLKGINDNFGHAEGDIAIRGIAECMENVLEDHGFCARFGGDEFVAARLWAGEEYDEDYPEYFQQALQREVDDWNNRQKKEYSLGASVGSVLETISCVDEIDELMKRADDNMYCCKERHHSVRGSRRDLEGRG